MVRDMRSFIKRHPKIFITIVFVVIVLFCYVFDFCISKSYQFEVVSVSPEVIHADPQQPVEITIKLTRYGKAVSGHDLYALPVGENAAGVFRQNRIRTDEQGLAVFVYYPYKATMFVPAAPVDIQIVDESNSILFVINAEFFMVLDIQEGTV